jgi:hypothetical protein
MTTPTSPWPEGFQTQIKCRSLSTPYNEEGGGNAVYLDRHNVDCGPNEVLGRFHLARESDSKGATGRYRYDYTCCQMTPAPSPSLSPAITEAPQKIQSLEAEVQRIQQKLQRPTVPSTSPSPIEQAINTPPISPPSAVSPVRHDILSENTLTPTGTSALSFGQQSNLLRDIRQIIRNEIYANRSTTPVRSEQ